MLSLKNLHKCCDLLHLFDILFGNPTIFYREFNLLYSKIPKANEFLITSPLKTVCVHVILYGLEAFSFNTSNLRALDTPSYNAMAKVFISFDTITIL